MEYRFHLSNYNAPGLKEETARLLQQHVEANSRQAVPKLWAITDKLNSRPKAPPEVLARRRKRYRIYGVFLIALGIFALVPGLVEPRVPSLIAGGVIGIAAGVIELLLSRKRKPSAPPLYCRQMAEELLAGRQAVDWSGTSAEILFDSGDVTLSTGKEQETLSYDSITGVFETEHLWLVIDEKSTALLLQKKDLVSGEADAFVPDLQGKIKK